MSFIDGIRKILPGATDGSNFDTATLKADANNDNKKKFDELIAAAYNGATGYVSPPASNIMGFGPASQDTTATT